MRPSAHVRAVPALDQAIELVRAQPLRTLLGCAAPGLTLSWLGLMLYYVERVEGIHQLRPLFACAVVLAFCARTLVLGRFAARCMAHELGPVAEPQVRAPTHVLLGSAAVMGCELWLWLWPVALAVRVDPWLCLLTLPLLALRGALAPTWLSACASLAQGGPWTALAHALRSARGLRLSGMACELFLLLGALALLINLGALLAALVTLSQDVLGLSLSFVRAFISPGNDFVLLALVGLSLSAFEPLRAALSGVLHAGGRSDAQTLELRALVQRCVESGTSRRVAALLLVGASLLALPRARAEDAAPPPTSAPTPSMPPPVGEPECDEVCRQTRARDDALLVQLVTLLARDEFQEFPQEPWLLQRDVERSLSRWLERVVAWLDQHLREGSSAPRPGRSLAVPELRALLAVAVGALFVALCGLLLLGLRAQRQPGSAQAELAPTEPRSAQAELAAALLLLEQDPTAALRGLYLASLRALSQRGSFKLVPHATNGEYLRQLPAGEARQALATLTALFDRARYGAKPVSGETLREAGQLARRLVQPSDGS